MILDVVHPILQVAVTFGQVNLQQVPQQVLQIGAEVGWESHLENTGDIYAIQREDIYISVTINDCCRKLDT